MVGLLIFSLFATGLASISDCSAGKSLFVVNGLGFWPDPAVKNANSTISFAFSNPGPVVSVGTVKYTYTYNFIPLTPTIEDLCTQTTCPIAVGSYNQSSSSTFPDLSGSINIKVEWLNSDSKQLLCVLIKTSVK